MLKPGLVVALCLWTVVQALGQTVGPPPPGQLVDVGGWRMHVHCTGDARPGRPTVVLEASAGDSSIEWSIVQPRLSELGRVCSYDRSGSGWSDLGPYPHTGAQIVYELHTALTRLRVAPPYVLVGHSMGGRYARMFAATYPDEIAGMVLVDSNHEDDLLFINGELRREWETATGNPVPSVKTSDPVREDQIPEAARQQIRAAADRLGTTALEPPYDKLSPPMQQARRWAVSQFKHVAANNSPFNGDEALAMKTARRGSPEPLNNLPLVVISRGNAPDPGPRAQERQERMQENQEDLARLSRNARRVIAGASGHHVQLDRPEVVWEAVRDVLDAVR